MLFKEIKINFLLNNKLLETLLFSITEYIKLLLENEIHAYGTTKVDFKATKMKANCLVLVRWKPYIAIS